jgi:rhodanese-related sulfurtransferase
VEKIDKETLRSWLGDPQVFIMDVRAPKDWEASDIKIEHAHRFDPVQPVASWAKDVPRDKKLVLY